MKLDVMTKDGPMTVENLGDVVFLGFSCFIHEGLDDPNMLVLAEKATGSRILELKAPKFIKRLKTGETLEALLTERYTQLRAEHGRVNE